MRPASFEYIRSQTLDEAVAALSAAGSEARVLAGGQSLIPAMTLRLARPTTLIDIGEISGLDTISVNSSAISIGARVTHADILSSAAIKNALPVFTTMAAHIAHPAIRNRGTFGGSIAHADPASEWPCGLLGLGGSVEAVSATGSRTIAAADLFLGPLTTALEPGEILTKATLPRFGNDWRWSFRELARQRGAFGLVLVLAGVRLADNGQIAEVSLAIGGCEGQPVMQTDAGAALIGHAPSGKAIDEAATSAAHKLALTEDVQLGVQERRDIARTLIRRALAEACGLGDEERVR